MRRIVFLGNCQIFWLHDCYRRFIAPDTGDVLTYVDPRTPLSAEDRAATEQADLIVQQRLEFGLAGDLTGLALRGDRQEFPLVTAAFLWPYAGRPHPHNAPAPGLPFGPYPDELGDQFLNRMIANGVAPELAVDAYMQLDVPAAAQLDRRYQISMEAQRHRDEITGYRFADLIGSSFRHNHIFVTPHHPGITVYRAMVAQFLSRMRVASQRIERVVGRTRGSPFGRDALPIHPAIGQHFGITFATPEHRYNHLPEGRFTFREYAERYMRFDWNPLLAAGLAAFHAGDHAVAREQIAAGLLQSPASASGHAAISQILLADGHPERAIAEIRLAVACDPEAAGLRVQLGRTLARAGDPVAAKQAVKEGITLAPDDPGGHIALSHLLFTERQLDQALPAALRAVELEPEVPDYHDHLSRIFARLQQTDAALRAAGEAVRLAPGRANYQERLSDLLEQSGDLEGAIRAARTAITLGGNGPVRRVRLDRLEQRRDAVRTAEKE
jgi:tetratricopeptide (TPR) repeat protein